MQTAANTNRFLTGCSSTSGLSDSEIMVSHSDLIQHAVVSHLARTIYSQDAFLKLTNALTHIAEQAYTLRDLDTLQEVSRILMSLPVNDGRQIGLYYHALTIKRNGQINEAQKLFETVVDNAPAEYRVRAIQGLSAVHHDLGQFDEALRLQLEAFHAMSSLKTRSLQTRLIAHLEVSHFKSDTGDHKGALAIIENVWPLVHTAAKENPFFSYVYHNELAIELGDLGRIAEAEKACAIALGYPFASAYPEWAETRDEIAAKRTAATPSVIAVNRAAESSPQIERRARTRLLKFRASNWPVPENLFLQRASVAIAATGTTAQNGVTQTILNRVLICTGSRAPPAFF